MNIIINMLHNQKGQSHHQFEHNKFYRQYKAVVKEDGQNATIIIISRSVREREITIMKGQKEKRDYRKRHSREG